ncbi:Electron transport complex protein RnfC [Lachnospiraceae bacterium TWA4]|nr:Electron transport complex protein RnfC [Lachnospiraceae bacterium TWA4]
MLITQLKSKETIASLASGKAFIIICHGCKEVSFPEAEAKALVDEFKENGKLTGSITTDYICNPDNMKLRLEKHMGEIQAADVVLVCSCGVGVQTIAEYLDNKKYMHVVIPMHYQVVRVLLHSNTTVISVVSVI